MTYSPITKNDINEMLKVIGIKSVDELYEIIPDKYKIDLNNSKLPSALSEQEIIQELSKIGNLNSASNKTCFLGGGSYDHYVPKVVDFLSSRSEYYTAYTPYQPEVSQGTLQYLYEFQSMLCDLSGMEIANASLYDGASAIAEACSMSMRLNKKNKILLSSTLNPNYIDVVKTYFSTNNTEVNLVREVDGKTCIDSFADSIDEETSCIVVQSPNYYGLLEDWENFVNSKKYEHIKVIAVCDPISLSLIKTPFDSGCDIYVGEGQSLGNYMSFGGPYVGVFCSLMKYARQMPGRIIGRTEDIDGKEGFVMTLQTREQHIRRERATSNICTNQGLIALRSTLYMALMGKNGIPGVAKMSFDLAQYAATEIDKLENFSLFDKTRDFLKEFVVKSKFPVKELIKTAYNANFRISGLTLDSSDSLLLLAFTEKRSKEEIDSLVSFLKNYQP